MKTVDASVSESIREKSSKFSGFLLPAESRPKFEEELKKIKSTYPDATHHCYAWRINPNNTKEFSQDDGEPGGTAGLPILNQLKSHDLINCGLMVVRYYGGTNLGKSGLIQAYGDVSRRCIGKANLLKLIPTKKFKINYPYNRQKQIDRLKNNYEVKELEAVYLKDITLEIACRSDQADSFFNQLQNLEHLDIKAEVTGEGYITFQ